MAHLIHSSRLIAEAAVVLAIVVVVVVALALTGCAAPSRSPEPEPRPERIEASIPRSDTEAPKAPVPVPEPASEVAVARLQNPDPGPAMPPEETPAEIPQSSSALVEGPAPEFTPEPVKAPASETATVPAPPPPARLNLAGRVVLTGRDADVVETVLYFVPDGPVIAPETGQFEIATRDKAFEPAVMVVTRGSVVRFPNQDPILHNVFSVSTGNSFDLGVYGPDAAPETRLEQTGAVNVYCNVHHEMHAHVLVLDTPWYVLADDDGGFTLTGLPTGSGTLHAWHRQAEAWSMRIPGDHSAPLDVRLNIVRPQLPAHTDKTGQSYFRKDRDPYR